MSIVTALLMSAIMLIFGQFILGSFIFNNSFAAKQAINIGYQFLIILSIFFPILYLIYVTRACLQGVGKAVVPMVSSIMQIIMRIVYAVFSTKLIGNSDIFYREIFARIGAEIILLIAYLKYFKSIT